MKRKIILSVFFVLLFCQCGQASFLDLLQDTLKQAGESGINKGKIDQGLKEALNVGIKNATRYLGKDNGYFTNAAVKILLPEEVRKAESVLRAVGFGPKLDEFTLSMNRAAEKAAPLARDIFLNTITDMSFDDANKILKGGNTAATDYLKTRTYDQLLELFQPAVRRAMNSYHVTQQYDAISGKVKNLPLVGKAIDPDVNRYVSEKALDGLFYTLAQEETSIRTNPKARVTTLLKEVFK